MGDLGQLRPGFIVGVGRSGTTLLASILNRHADVCVTPETHFFRLTRQYPGGVAAFLREWPGSLDYLARHVEQTHGWRLDRRAIPQRLRAREPCLREIFLALGTSMARHSNKPLWVEKTPAHIRDYATIRECFTDAPMIHVVRDGRDVAASLCRVDWASDSFAENLFRWRYELEALAQAARDDRCLLALRYEDLLAHPERQVRRICAFLGIEYSPGLLEPDGSEGWLIERGSAHKAKIRDPIDVSRACAWKRALGPGKRRLAAAIAHEMLATWSYESERPETNGRVRIDFPAWYRTYPAALDELLEVATGMSGLTIEQWTSREQVLRDADCGLAVSASRHELDTKGLDRVGRLTHYWRLRRFTGRVRRRGPLLVWWHHGDLAWSRGRGSRLESERLYARAAGLIVSPDTDTRETAALLDVDERRVVHHADPRFADRVRAALRPRVEQA